jgi:hypothetical protein
MRACCAAPARIVGIGGIVRFGTVPTTRISSRSTVTSGVVMNQPSGRRPANQAVRDSMVIALMR